MRALLLLLAFMLIPFHAAFAQQPGGPAPAVTIAKPLKQTVSEWDEFTGRFEAIDDVMVRARVSGYLESVHFKDGAMVKKGDLLFVIDPRPYQAKVTQAEADVKVAETQVSFANSQFKRAEELLASGDISRQIYDERKQQRDQTLAQLESAKANLQSARLDLSYTRITAPVSGRISRKMITEGNLVTAGDQKALTNIVSLDPIYFTFDIDEKTYLKYTRLAQTGARKSSRDYANPVRISLADENTFNWPGTMDFVDNAIDAGTGTMRGRAVVPNSDLLITPGMFGRVRIAGRGAYEAVLVPDEAVGTDQSRKFVLTVTEDGTVKSQTITPGTVINGFRVIESGLNGSEWIVVNGTQRAQDGAKVAAERITLKAPPGLTDGASNTPRGDAPAAGQ